MQVLDWFEWNGTRCTTYGIHVSEQPPISIPAERATFTNVPGRPGSLTTLEGSDVYDDQVLSATCFIQNPSAIPQIAAWLRGSGTVTFANRQGGFYYARVVNQISFEKILRGNPHRSFAVNFRCHPFFYLADVEDVVINTSGTLLTNPGSVFSEPVVSVTMSGNAQITIGATYFELTGINGTVVVDTPLMETYLNYTSYNSHMSGDYPKLLTGNNIISWTGNVHHITIQPNWRTL